MANIKTKFKKPLHPIQMQILEELIKLPTARYRDLYDKSIESKQFNYHLKELIKLNFVTKTASGLYILTLKGKQFVSDIDLFISQKVEYGKRTVLLRPTLQTSSGLKILMYKRLKQPMYGFIGFPAGKVPKNESPLQAALREFTEETHLHARYYELIKIERDVLINPETNSITHETYFYVFNIYDPIGTLNTQNEEGQYFWTTIKDALKLNLYEGMKEDKTYPTSWIYLENRYKRFKKLLKDGKWHNIPEKVDLYDFKNKKFIVKKHRIYYQEWFSVDKGY